MRRAALARGDPRRRRGRSRSSAPRRSRGGRATASCATCSPRLSRDPRPPVLRRGARRRASARWPRSRSRSTSSTSSAAPSTRPTSPRGRRGRGGGLWLQLGIVSPDAREIAEARARLRRGRVHGRRAPPDRLKAHPERNRGARIRTGDLADPNGARYQAALHPEPAIGYRLPLEVLAARDEIISWADEYLDVASYPDYGPMGLQVTSSAPSRRRPRGSSSEGAALATPGPPAGPGRGARGNRGPAAGRTPRPSGSIPRSSR